MKLTNTDRNLFRNADGTVVIEFAFVVPLLVTLVLSIMNLGIYFNAKSDVNNALDEAARYSSINPTELGDTEDTFRAKLVREYAASDLAFTTATGSKGPISYIELNAETAVNIDLVFVTLGDIPIRAQRRVWVTG